MSKKYFQRCARALCDRSTTLTQHDRHLAIAIVAIEIQTDGPTRDCELLTTT
ncbi:MAG TPA: hypothetical protein VJT15_08525 [Pyrinomonadaceae bacterium]|nr:hypothetical protein [Pyrinomonadaceae bacterium]